MMKRAVFRASLFVREADSHREQVLGAVAVREVKGVYKYVLEVFVLKSFS